MFNAYFTEAVQRVNTTVDAYGEQTETLVNIRAKVVWDTKLVSNEAGEDVMAAGFLLVSKSLVIAPGDRFKINGRYYSALRVSELGDLSVRAKKVFVR